MNLQSTNELRWVLVGADLTLQQKWMDMDTNEIDWRVVPIVDGSEVGVSFIDISRQQEPFSLRRRSKEEIRKLYSLE